jgi:hypothetical protein
MNAVDGNVELQETKSIPLANESEVYLIAYSAIWV